MQQAVPSTQGRVTGVSFNIKIHTFVPIWQLHGALTITKAKCSEVNPRGRAGMASRLGLSESSYERLTHHITSACCSAPWRQTSRSGLIDRDTCDSGQCGVTAVFTPTLHQSPEQEGSPDLLLREKEVLFRESV